MERLGERIGLVPAAIMLQIDEALRLAARDARRLHKALGSPMATWQDGRVIWIPPEEIDVDDDGEEA